MNNNSISSLMKEVSPALSDKRSAAIARLLASRHSFENFQMFFEMDNDYSMFGILKINSSKLNIQTFFTVYIRGDDIWASLFSLDMKLLIDIPFKDYLKKLKQVIKKSI